MKIDSLYRAVLPVLFTIFGLFCVSILAFSDALLPGAPDPILFKERVQGESNRYYIMTVHYDTGTGKVVHSIDDSKKDLSVSTLASATTTSPYSYGIEGYFKDSLGTEVTYQSSTSRPVSINALGDVFFTTHAGDLDYETLSIETNKGIYDFTINAFQSGEEITNSGTPFQIKITNDTSEYRITPLYFSYTPARTEGTLTGKEFRISAVAPRGSSRVANFWSTIKNELGTEDLSYDLVYSIKESEYDTDGCQFFIIDATSAIMSFKPDDQLSTDCLSKKSTYTTFDRVKLDVQSFTKPTIDNPIPQAGPSSDFVVTVTLTESATPVPTVVVTPAPTPVPTSIPSSGGGGGGGYDPIRWATTTPTPSPTLLPAPPTATPLPEDVCESIAYKRYPENRGKGVSSALFSDADGYHRAYKSLIDLGEQKVVNGDQATGKARLDDSISRAEFVKIVTVGRQDTLGTDLCLKASLFPDVLKTDWFSRFVWNMESRSFVNGYDDGYYRPAKNINVVEAYKIIALAFEYIDPIDAKLAIKNTGVEWYVPYKKALESADVIPGWFKEYRLDAAITRGDMFALLSNVLKDIDGVL